MWMLVFLLLGLRYAQASRPTVPEPVLPTFHEIRLPLPHAVVAPTSPLNEAERIALARLEERLHAIGTPTPTVLNSVSSARGSAGAITLVVGRWRPALARRFPHTAHLLQSLTANPTAFRRRDGFVISMERAGKTPVVCAVGLESPGAVYAIGYLHAHALRDGVGPTLQLASAPKVETPALDQRELYLNIGYGLRRPRITVEDWSLADWKRYIDHLILARYNTWSFYLWGDSEVLHPAAAQNHALNLRLHNMLLQAIAYSHRRGMRVGLHFTPTMLPTELWKAHPELHAKLEYAYPGTFCPSQPESVRLMKEVYSREIRWFAACDFFSLWFYDVGGCFCETCRVPEQQLRTLMEQVKTYGEMARQANPRATFQVMTWAIWRYERMHHYSIRDPFVTETKRWFAGRQPLQMADGIFVDTGSTPLFDLMQQEKIPAKVFLYQTNIETGEPLPIVLTRYLSKWLPDAVRAGATSAFLMRMEAGTKTADDAVAGCYLWNPEVSADEALYSSAQLLTGDTQAARLTREALRRMDDFAWFGYTGGGADAAQGRRIAELAQRAVAAAPPALRSDLEWLRAGGEAYGTLGAAVEANDKKDDAAIQTQDAAFSAIMRGSPLFHYQADGAPYWRNLFRTSLVRFFYEGWSNYHF